VARSSANKGIFSARELIGSVFSGRRWQTFLPRAVIWQRWPEIVGEHIAKVSWPWYFKDLDTLVVAVTDSIWIQQLSFEAPLLLERINRHLPENSRLKGLRFMVGNVESIRAETERFIKRRAKRKTSSGSLQARPEIPPEHERMLETIEDQELRNTFKRLLCFIEDDHGQGRGQ